jgi:hypothetical protein
MRRVCCLLIFVVVGGVISAPAVARAEGYVIPWAGVNFGSDQAEGKKTFGVSAGFMGAGVAGLEFDFGYSPNFFGESVTNHALTVMGNVIIGVPVGGTRGLGIRPYVTGGVGIIRSNVNGGVTSNTTTNAAGFNVGFGAMGYFSDHIGLRGDVRYFRDFQDNLRNPFIDVGTFHFWRGSIGLVLR